MGNRTSSGAYVYTDKDLDTDSSTPAVLCLLEGLASLGGGIFGATAPSYEDAEQNFGIPASVLKKVNTTEIEKLGPLAVAAVTNPDNIGEFVKEAGVEDGGANADKTVKQIVPISCEVAISYMKEIYIHVYIYIYTYMNPIVKYE